METIIATFPEWEPFFYRTAAGTELDLILVLGNRKIAFEFKASTTPHVTKGFWNGLKETWILNRHGLLPLSKTATHCATM